jgi:hypothetical protein
MTLSVPSTRRSVHAVLARLALGAGAVAASAGFAQASILDVNFEAYAVGRLGAPWSVTPSSGGSTASIESTGTVDHGKVLLLRGATSSNYLIASLGLFSSAPEATVKVDVKPATGASFIWSFHGAGTSIGRRRIRLQRAPGSTTLVAQTVPSGSTNCGTLQSVVWSTIMLIVHSQTRTFDVRINGTPTCTGISTGLSPPFNKVSVMDAGNEGWGGDVRFDNILVTVP